MNIEPKKHRRKATAIISLKVNRRTILNISRLKQPNHPPKNFKRRKLRLKNPPLKRRKSIRKNISLTAADNLRKTIQPNINPKRKRNQNRLQKPAKSRNIRFLNMRKSKLPKKPEWKQKVRRSIPKANSSRSAKNLLGVSRLKQTVMQMIANDYSTEDASAEESTSYQPDVSQSDFHIPATSEYEFRTDQAVETETAFTEEEKADEVITPQFDTSQFEQVETPAMEDFSSPETTDSYTSYEAPTEAKEPAYAEPVETVSQSVMSQPVRTRFSERNVDLPIDVAEDERRLHNDARRFARLLVSEIKLYNEQKVNEGRTSYDLYERLREAIDRSRDMYDKRVQPPVAAKFDYFHYELINSLAEGDESKLGGSYPGTNV